MELTGLGGGIMLAVAAALWLAYLLPNWLKRREYMATERNAVRLQQTIRVLAETAQVPDVVKAARSAPFPVAVGRAAAPQPAVDPRVLTALRIRRSRVLSTVVLASAVLLGVVQIAVMATAGWSIGAWVVLALSAALAVTSVGMLGRLAVRAQAAPARRSVRRTTLGYTAAAPAAARPVAKRTWTPTAVPKPLYLDKPNAPAVVPEVDLARAAEHAQQVQREIAAATPAVASTSRFARMGYLDDVAAAAPDLDEVLARRRAAG